MLAGEHCAWRWASKEWRRLAEQTRQALPCLEAHSNTRLTHSKPRPQSFVAASNVSRDRTSPPIAWIESNCAFDQHDLSAHRHATRSSTACLTGRRTTKNRARRASVCVFVASSRRRSDPRARSIDAPPSPQQTFTRYAKIAVAARVALIYWADVRRSKSGQDRARGTGRDRASALPPESLFPRLRIRGDAGPRMGRDRGDAADCGAP